MNDNCTKGPDGGPRETTVGTAVVGFERGEMKLTLVRRGEELVWLHGRKPFGCPLATIAAAVQFLKEVCEIYNLTLEPPSRGERAQRF
jgi:hypothetical protein